MKKNILFLLLLFCKLAAAQTTSNYYTANMPMVIPQSPQAAAFARYGEYPVSMATGVPQIDIPLYEIKMGDIRLPISISYHASGIKVEDVATPVGLGWALNTGGVITRSINGCVDELGYTNNKVKSVQQVKELMAKSQYDDSWKRWCKYLSGEDTQSDRYIYNFNGKTGVFRYNSLNNAILTIPYTPLVIETTSQGFKIKDTDGLIYYFEATECSTPSSLAYVTAWYVTKIESQLTGNSINFKYKPGSNYNEDITNQTVSRGRAWHMELVAGLAGDYYTMVEDPFCQSCLENIRTMMSYRPVLLDEITWGNNKIKLNYTTDRKDKYKDRLNSININAGSVTMKTIVFDNNVYFGDNARNYRMKLNSVEIKGENNASSGEKYQFSYNTVALPDYNNFQQTVLNIRCREDYWGYYTGKSSNNFIPKEYCELSSNFSADRNPDETYMKAGILTGISYPTGGTTTFEYEANRAARAYDYRTIESPVGGLRVKSITSKTNNEEIKKSYEYFGHANEMIRSNMFQYDQMKFYSGYGAIPVAQYYIKTDNWRINTSSPLYSITGRSSSPVFYDSVAVYTGTANANTGKTIYKFIDYHGVASGYEYNVPNNVDSKDIPRFWSSYYNYDLGLSNPLLESEDIYEFSGNKYTLKRQVKNNYSIVNKGNFTCGVLLGLRDMWIHEGVDRTYEYPPSIDPRLYFPYTSMQDFYKFDLVYYDLEADRSFFLLSSTVTTDYNSNGNTVNTVSYAYDTNLRTLSPIKTTIVNSDGKSQIESITYPFNLTTAPYVEMVQNNVVDPVIKRTRQNTNASISIQNNYRKNGSLYVVDNVQSGLTNSLETRITYPNYDIRSNPLYILKDNADKVVYLWGYNYQYPIAEIKGAAYSDVTGKISESSLNTIAAKSEPAAADWTTINNLRTQLPNALVTTYTYKPLVGIQTMTDPRGVVTKYDYDSFGRLIKVTQADRVIESYEYHYKN